MREKREDWQELSDEQWRLVEKLWTLLVWDFAAPLWVRADFRCEYCHADLLGDPQTYQLAQGDHILPQSKHRDLAQDQRNIAAACGLCNHLKRNWDPAEEGEFEEVKSLSTESRKMLLKRCRKMLDEKRRILQSQLEDSRAAMFRVSEESPDR